MPCEQTDIIGKIKAISQATLNTEVLSIYPFDTITNNRVFKIETRRKAYIFKIYNNNWPEDGKLPFVSGKLADHNIPHAKILAFNREDDNFPNGFLIEECLPGITADRITLSSGKILEIFHRLANLISKVHKIGLMNYGYIGHGIAQWTTFSEFVFDSFKDCTSHLLFHNLLSNSEYENVRERLYAKLTIYDSLPPTLCHGDLSTKNILVNDNEITLIDWDDAHSLCWVADVARLTLWMKLNYDAIFAAECRKAFLDNYETEFDMQTFWDLEDTFHVWYGFDYLNFFIGKPQYEAMTAVLCESRKRARI